MAVQVDWQYCSLSGRSERVCGVRGQVLVGSVGYFSF